MLNITLTASQERAIRWLVQCLEEAAACYQFAGGFAGNLHGSRWPLQDLDVDVAKQDLPRLSELLKPYIYRPFGPFEDSEFRINLLFAQFEGVEIDVNQAEDAYGRSAGRWLPLRTDLALRQRVPVLDLHVWVQPLDALIEYKQLIGRVADLAELKTLKRRV